MNKIVVPPLPDVDNIPDLRIAIFNAINNVVSQLNSGKQSGPLDMNGNRIINVASPASLTDGVNKLYVDQTKGGGTTVVTGGGGGGGGSTAPPTMVIYCLGDSLTLGHPLEGTYKTYPAQLQSKIAVKVNNIGVNGAQTGAMLSVQVPLATACLLYTS